MIPGIAIMQRKLNTVGNAGSNRCAHNAKGRDQQSIDADVQHRRNHRGCGNNGSFLVIVFIIHREGAKEIEKIKKAGIPSVTLGKRILRTETAPLYALSAISVLWE